MSASRPACSRMLRALRAARSASASTSGRADRPRGAGSPAGRAGTATPDFTRLARASPTPRSRRRPRGRRAICCSRRTRRRPCRDARGEGDEGEDFIGSEALRRWRAARPAAARRRGGGRARGVNEVLRFVRALDHIEGVDHLEPMWSTLSEDHDSGPGRDDKGFRRGWRRFIRRRRRPRRARRMGADATRGPSVGGARAHAATRAALRRGDRNDE